MNNKEFNKYIDNSIVPLYPDLEDMPRKQVLLEVDSGPGCNGRDLLNKARFRGVYLFPGLPNATSVQQERDINYGPFKFVVHSNLKKITTACFLAQKSMKLGLSTFGLIVYGSVCPISNVVCKNAVNSAFNVESNLHLWAEVGAVPFTMKCLVNKKVGHNRTDRYNPNLDAFLDVQLQNDYSTTQLTMTGYKGEMLWVQYLEDKVQALQTAAPVTVPHTRKRQEALATTTTHRKKFFMRGGKHITSDDMFKSAKIVSQNAEAVEREKDRKRRVSCKAQGCAPHPQSSRK